MRTPTPQLMALLLLLAAVPEASERPTGWMEVRTAHVILKTDLGPEDARRAALMAERIRNALLAGAWPGAKLLQPEHLDLVVLADHSDFARLFGDFILGEFLQIDYPPTVFLYGPPEKWETRRVLQLEETTSVLKHEMAHHLAAFFYRREPKWFAEGFAQFLETVRFSEDGKSVILGDINLEAVRNYNSNRTVTVADALSWGTTFNPTDQASILGLYGLSWLMVHWMNNTHPAEYERFQTLLVKGIDPDKAWKAAFPNVVPADLDKELNQFEHYGEYRNPSVPIPEADLTLHERPMTQAEVHATRAYIALAAALNPQNRAAHAKEGLAELSAALAADPGNVQALRMQMGLVKSAQRVALGRRATAAHPDDGLAWLTLADALRDAGENWEECTEAYRKATELLPDHPAAFNALAFMALQKGRASEALPLAVTAARMAPWDAGILDTLAAALMAVGRCSEAFSTEARALDMLPENASPAQRAGYAARLASLQKRCSESAAEPPPVSSVPQTGAPAPKP